MTKCKIVVKPGSKMLNIPPRQVPVRIAKAVELEVQKLLDRGIIVESDMEWSSPMVLVKKKNGGIHLCVDYRQLNVITPLRWF